MGKRLFDIVFSMLGIVFVLIPSLIISFLIVVNSRGGVFYRQVRIGKNELPFKIFKFRTMRTESDKAGLLTVGAKDHRVTEVGYYLRKYKIDELPQLLNILLGQMSFVGPRPEVAKYVDLYTVEQRKVLQVRPGLTDFASINFIDENELLSKSSDPERTYIEHIMPQKIEMGLDYVDKMSLKVDLWILMQTFYKIIKR